MHSEPIHLVIAINQKYIRYAYVMLTSLLLHTSCDVHVYVLHRELSAADQQMFDTLTFLSCDVSLYPCAGYTASSPKGSRNKCLGRRGLFPARNHGSYAILR